MSEWISVKDKLPEEGQWVIAFGVPGKDLPANWVKGKPATAITQYLYNEHIKLHFWNLLTSGCECCDKSFDNVTHWMPLPAPPKTLSKPKKHPPLFL